MRISDYYVSFLKDKGVRHIFALQGSGTVLQMLDSIASCDGIDYVCTLHEEAAGMAANGYAQAGGGLGVAVATSGPGATNLYTAVSGAWQNSIPVLFIVGNAPTGELRKNDSLRFFSYHENDILKSFECITKYTVQVEQKECARYEIEKAVFLALNGRPGPVVVSLPDNITWLEIDPEQMEGFDPEKEGYPLEQLMNMDNADKLEECLNLMALAERPVLIFGNGVRLSGAVEEALEVSEHLQWPVAPTWGMRDCLAEDNPLFAGSFGVQGVRSGNFTVQNADLILAVGTRFDRSETGADPALFAREAKVVYVDIDRNELGKKESFGIKADLAVRADAKEFLSAMLEHLKKEKSRFCPPVGWLDMVKGWREKYPVFLPEYRKPGEVHPYEAVRVLSGLMPEKVCIITDTSTSRNIMFQSFAFKEGQRMASWLNFACLGYGLPAAVGACFAVEGPVFAVMGDGALQFNIQELSTVVSNRLNLKIIVFDNDGYGTIRRSQDKYLDGRHQGVDRGSGLPLPDSTKIAAAYGLPTVEIHRNEELEERLRSVVEKEGPVYCAVHVSIEHWTQPVRIGKDPIEDMTPKLAREEFYQQMLVKPVS